MTSADSSVSAFPCTSPCDAGHGTGVQQAGWCLQLGTWLCPGLRPCVKLPVVHVWSGMNLCFTVLCPSLYFSHFWIALWFSTSLQHNGSLWIYSAINSPLPVPESTWHFLPQAEKHRYGAEISLLKAVPWAHGNIYPDPYEIIHWSPAVSCPKFKHHEHNSKVLWCMDVTWNHLEQRSGMENLCLAQGRACGLLAIVYCCFSTCTQAYQNVFAGLLQLPCTAFNSSFEDLCELSSSRQCSKRVNGESSAGARLKSQAAAELGRSGEPAALSLQACWLVSFPHRHKSRCI